MVGEDREREEARNRLRAGAFPQQEAEVTGKIFPWAFSITRTHCVSEDVFLVDMEGKCRPSLPM